jgi:hypothetical protein
MPMLMLMSVIVIVVDRAIPIMIKTATTASLTTANRLRTTAN